MRLNRLRQTWFPSEPFSPIFSSTTLKTVRVRGTIAGITILPLQGSCRTIDSYLFEFEDEAGRIEVFDNGWCVEGRRSGSPTLVLPPVQIGERISVTTIIMSPIMD
jgi:hypothetical protein